MDLDLGVIQQLSDFREQVNAFFQNLNLLNLIITLFLFTIYTLVYATRRQRIAEETWGYLILIFFTVLSYSIAAYSDIIFTEQNANGLYTNFFSNLGTEFFAFLILIMCRMELDKLLQRSYLKIMTALVVISISAVVLNNLSLIDKLPMNGMTIPHITKIVFDIIIEFLTIPITLALLIVIELIRYCTKEYFTTPNLLFHLVVVCILCIVIIVPTIMLSIHNTALAIAILGGIFTFTTMNEYVEKTPNLKRVATSIYALIVVLLIINIIKLPLNSNVTISAELYGALLPIILIK
jgi:hypothetical protein